MVYNGLKEVVPFHKSGHIYIYRCSQNKHPPLCKHSPSYFCPMC